MNGRIETREELFVRTERSIQESHAMRVKVYKIDQNTGEETFERTCDLTDLFPERDEGDEPAYADAHNELAQVGRVWIGGGAAPLFLLVRT
jgi:hypothetical protein